MQIKSVERTVEISPLKLLTQLFSLFFVLQVSVFSQAATVSGDLTVATNFLELYPVADETATGVDFGDAVIAADGVLDTDASTGAAFSFINGTGDFAGETVFGSQSLNAQFYDFDLSGVLNAQGLIFQYNDYIVEDSGNGVTMVTTSGSGGLVPTDFNGTGILKSASSAFDDTQIAWKLGLTGINGGQITIYAAGLSVPNDPVPLPASAWLFISGLLGLAAVKRRR